MNPRRKRNSLSSGFTQSMPAREVYRSRIVDKRLGRAIQWRREEGSEICQVGPWLKRDICRLLRRFFSSLRLRLGM